MSRILAIVTLTLAALVVPWPAATPTVEAAARATIARRAVVPSSVPAGTTGTVEARVRSRPAATLTINAVVTGPGNVAVWQTSWANQAFAAGQTQAFSGAWAVPAGQPAGRYRLTIQVVTPEGRSLARKTTTFRVVAAPAGVAPAPAPPAAGLDAEEAAFLSALNGYRQARGLPALTANASLTAAARWHSGDMAANGRFSHTDSQGRDPFARMAAFGYTANTYKGENIAAGYGSAASVLAGWQTSPGHNANMLNANFRAIGIGRVHRPGSPYGTYWTTTFGGA